MKEVAEISRDLDRVQRTALGGSFASDLYNNLKLRGENYVDCRDCRSMS